MNYKETVSNILKDPRPAASLILIAAVIVFLMSRCSPDTAISIDPKGFAKGGIINFTYFLDGQIVVSTSKGKVLQKVKANKENSLHKGSPLIDLKGISIAAVRGDKNRIAMGSKKNGLFEMILPQAHAHFPQYHPDHIVELRTQIGNDVDCNIYDITNYPPQAKFLGKC